MLFLSPMSSSSEYRPGLHILASFSADEAMLRDMAQCRQVFDGIILKHGLQKVGEAYHAFDAGGFTAIVALTESHISIHTWPEHGMATFDVFLSNFLRDNTAVVRAVYRDTLLAFRAREISKSELRR